MWWNTQYINGGSISYQFMRLLDPHIRHPNQKIYFFQRAFYRLSWVAFTRFCRQIHQCARIGVWRGVKPGFWMRLFLKAVPLVPLRFFHFSVWGLQLRKVGPNLNTNNTQHKVTPPGITSTVSMLFVWKLIRIRILPFPRSSSYSTLSPVHWRK